MARDMTGIPAETLAWLLDPQLREYGDFMAGKPARSPDIYCGCGRKAEWDIGPVWHGKVLGRAARCDWCVGPGPSVPLRHP